MDERVFVYDLFPRACARRKPKLKHSVGLAKYLPTTYVFITNFVIQKAIVVCCGDSKTSQLNT